MFVCCECCVLSGRGLCDELITCPGESYVLWCVVVCDLENLKNEEAMTRVGSQRHSKINKYARELKAHISRVVSYNKPTRCTKFSNIFWKETLHFSDSFSVYH
jgi:hypothetical protein